MLKCFQQTDQAAMVMSPPVIKTQDPRTSYDVAEIKACVYTRMMGV